ncbi:hypothetical protein SAMN05216316_3065 [Nitrosovibrio sp. Nv6]|nr:hypothetical protein SAMN05216316_3065 [Nitrosovibrio sp. Nv6]
MRLSGKSPRQFICSLPPEKNVLRNGMVPITILIESKPVPTSGSLNLSRLVHIDRGIQQALN